MGRKLCVGNLPLETGENDLHALFTRVGTVERVAVMRDLATGRARGFAFVEMRTDADAQRAIRELNRYEFGGRDLAVTEVPPKPSTGGALGGGGSSRRRSEPRTAVKVSDAS